MKWLGGRDQDFGAVIASAMAEAGDRRTQLLADQEEEREATWRERALNAEDALKAAHGEILAQRTRINTVFDNKAAGK